MAVSATEKQDPCRLRAHSNISQNNMPRGTQLHISSCFLVDISTQPLIIYCTLHILQYHFPVTSTWITSMKEHKGPQPTPWAVIGLFLQASERCQMLDFTVIWQETQLPEWPDHVEEAEMEGCCQDLTMHTCTASPQKKIKLKIKDLS